jgi:hypothetical protein
LIPSNLLALVLVLASLGPGFAYATVESRYRPRGARTQLAELLEFLTVGASCTVLAACVIFGLAQLFHVVDVGKLSTETHAYFKDHPGRIIGAGLLSLVLAFFVAGVSAYVLYRNWGNVARTTKSGLRFAKDGSIWTEAMALDRPGPNAGVGAAIELTDGRRIVAAVKAFSTGEGDNRELRLEKPITMQFQSTGPMKSVDFDFILLREKDIRWIAGSYIEGDHNQQPADPA